MTNNEDNFQLLDLIGSENLIEYNEQKNILVYTSGCLLSYWEIGTDKRVYIKYHDGNIGNIKFSKCNNLLLSIDKTRVPKMVFWNCSDFSISFQSKIPLTLSNYRDQNTNLNTNNDLIDDVYTDFLEDNHLIILFNFEGKQSFFLFEIRKEINLIFECHLDIDNYCTGLTTFEDCNKFATQESKMIKIWKIEGLKVKLLVKVHLKEKILKNSIAVCTILKLIIVLTEKGNAIILDDQGNFVISLMSSNQQESYSCCLIINENCYLGSNKGSFFIYNLNGFKLVCNIPYDPAIKLKFINNKDDNNIDDMLKTLKNTSLRNDMTKTQYNYSLEKKINNSGPLMSRIIISEDNDLIITKFIDNSFLIKNISECYVNNVIMYNKNITLNTKLFIYNYSHFSTIKDILWLNDDPKSFLTTSEDQSLMIWNYRGDKWINNYFDILKIFDFNLNNFNFYSNSKNFTNYQSKNNSSYHQNSHSNNNFTPQKYFINCLALHPRYQNTFVGGDNKGNLYIFNIELDKKVKKIVVGNFGVNSLSFSKYGNYLAIGFETGQVILTDFYNDCKFCIKLEDHFNDELEMNMRKNLNNFLSYVYLMKKNLSTINNHLSTSNYYFSLQDSENSMKIVTMHNINSLIVQNITFQQNTFLENKIKSITINPSIKSIEMHPSEEYIIVLTHFNKVMIIRTDSGEICGEIVLSSFCYSIKVDPSGLYLAILSNMDEGENQPDNNIQFLQKKSLLSSKKSAIFSSKMNDDLELKSNLVKQRKHEGNSGPNSSKTTNPKAFINFYEIGTGNYFSTLSNLFKISNFKYSNDGRFICICAETGVVSVWELIKEMKENMISILIEMQKNTRFWEGFRINYQNSKKYDYKEILNSRSFEKSDKPINKEHEIPKKDEDFNKSINDNCMENKFYRKTSSTLIEQKNINENMINKHSINKFIDNEAQTNQISQDRSNNYNIYKNNNKNKTNLLEQYEKKKFKEESNEEKSVKSVYINYGDETGTINSKSFQKSNFGNFNSKEINNNDVTNKSIQTSHIIDYNNRINQKKKEEWNDLHSNERQGLQSDKMRIINMDPSIYEKNIPSVIEKQSNERYRISNASNVIPQLQNLNIEENSKVLQDKIRQKNIERAIKELEIPNKDLRNSKSNNSSELYRINDQNNIYNKTDLSKDTRLNGINYHINNTKEARDKNILPDPDDIDDLEDGSRDKINNQMRSQINVSSLSQKLCETDDIENAYDKMQKFDKMHKF